MAGKVGQTSGNVAGKSDKPVAMWLVSRDKPVAMGLVSFSLLKRLRDRIITYQNRNRLMLTIVLFTVCCSCKEIRFC